MTARFTRLRSGDWGIRVEGAVPEPGQIVEVAKREGTKLVKVERVLWSDATAALCAIADAPADALPPPVTNGTAPAPAPARAPALTKPATKFPPTPEQQTALDLFATGKSLAIEAGAGTGKTSTLLLLADSTNRLGQYVAFNRKIVEEGKRKFPANVACNTAHSLAYHAVGKQFSKRLDGVKRLKSTELATILKLDPIEVTTWTNEKKRLGPPFLAGLVMRAVTRFCQTVDAEPTWRHVGRVENLDAPPTEMRPSRYPVNEAVAKAVEPALKRAWADLQRYEGALPFTPAHYLKMWQLGNPHIDADFILFDEAQDASPVMVDIIARQKHAQLVWVGDSQQQIYSFTGAINALATVPAEQRAFLTQSFRFGPAIAELANRPLEHLRAELRLTGTNTIASSVAALDEPRAVLTRTNATAVRGVLETLSTGRRPFLVGGGSEITSFARAARDLMATGHTDHPELACFDSWGEVKAYVEEDEQGDDLALMVKLIDEFGVERILDALDPKRAVREEHADVIYSTAHKSKGLEWDSVQIGSDFKDAPEGEELRLLYVAVTRARLQVDVTQVGFFNDPDLEEVA